MQALWSTFHFVIFISTKNVFSVGISLNLPNNRRLEDFDSSPPRMLVVDDQQSMCEMLADTLGPRGYEVELADLGQASPGIAQTRSV